ncbi:uncharacterized protein NDAI_0D00410 [Naumovozyma dairenensis CBS 421]|uniref:Uncharacterized protein n=1 Tax=Naumovozyma dairenensis (strain ATCC 10597 / BCRC 20456 / CBS 421 / NBRC 0211 / NRRL Y-12639) TaxID=1071378 RepID=G0W994_NAUDC|nr:hypothetical protein NDAI_0D00410 [Naumovozyma dairenensis CBS 421]CCD24355.1 hypothetical protein NDAI_0D00410 [Naumovozyma dairenensis CBS 421]
MKILCWFLHSYSIITQTNNQAKNKEMNSFTYTSIQKQKRLLTLVEQKLSKCAKQGETKGYNLREMVGHANLLDQLLDNIQNFENFENHQRQHSYYYNNKNNDMMGPLPRITNYADPPISQDDDFFNKNNENMLIPRNLSAQPQNFYDIEKDDDNDYDSQEQYHSYLGDTYAHTTTNSKSSYSLGTGTAEAIQKMNDMIPRSYVDDIGNMSSNSKNMGRNNMNLEPMTKLPECPPLLSSSPSSVVPCSSDLETISEAPLSDEEYDIKPNIYGLTFASLCSKSNGYPSQSSPSSSSSSSSSICDRKDCTAHIKQGNLPQLTN